MEAPDTFSMLPITVDPSTKAVSLTTTIADPSLAAEIATLNALHRTMLSLDTPNSVPPPPVPVNPKRSQQISKLRDSGNVLFRKGQYQDAVRMYSLGIEMALGRPHWEPQGLVREEVAGLYANRAQAYMAQREWADGALDAETSLEMKKPQNAKAWWRRSKCLLEMGRLEEAREVVGLGLEWEPEGDLVGLKKDIESAFEKRGVN